MRSGYFVFIFVLSVLMGCGESGPPLAPVKGKVTLYGKPYTKGLVVFTPEGGGPTGTSQTDENGDYEIWSSGRKGAMVGKHKISVTTIMEPVKEAAPPGQVSSDDPGYTAFGGAADYKKAKEMKEPIPAKFNSKSELLKDVESGQNTIDLDLR